MPKQFGLWTFFFLFVAYAVVSLVLFFLTSGGIFGVLYYGFAGGFIVIFTIFYLLIRVLRIRSRGQRYVTVRWNFLRSVLILQTFILLFNPGDTADCGIPCTSDNQFYFIERVLGKVLGQGTVQTIPILDTLQMIAVVLIMLVVYVVFTVKFINATLRTAHTVRVP